MKRILLLFLPLLAVVLVPSISLASTSKAAQAKLDAALNKAFIHMHAVNLKSTDSVTVATNKDLKKALTKTFGKVKLVEDMESTSQDIQPNSLLIYGTNRMIHTTDVTRLKTELEKLGYKTIAKSNQSILLQKGTQYTTTVSIVSDIEDAGRALVRVLVI